MYMIAQIASIGEPQSASPLGIHVLARGLESIEAAEGWLGENKPDSKGRGVEYMIIRTVTH